MVLPGQITGGVNDNWSQGEAQLKIDLDNNYRQNSSDCKWQSS